MLTQKHYDFLTDEQVEQFLTRGFLVIKNAISRDKTKAFTERAYKRLGIDPNDRSTWSRANTQLDITENWNIKQIAPKVWGAICEVMGGEDRIHACSWTDHFRINLGADDHPQTWQSPAEAAVLKNFKPAAGGAGWHADGGWYVRFLDSFEVGLQTLTVWTDNQPKGGGTFMACDSVGVVARYLAQHPEGMRRGHFPGEVMAQMLSECHDLVEMVAEAGDVYLIHPFLLHTTSRNALRIPRIIMNTHARLKQPMNFNRQNPDDFSLVEKGILRGLGVDRLDFQPTRQRECIERGKNGELTYKAYTALLQPPKIEFTEY